MRVLRQEMIIGSLPNLSRKLLSLVLLPGLSLVVVRMEKIRGLIQVIFGLAELLRGRP
jgi:hypothetical protein